VSERAFQIAREKRLMAKILNRKFGSLASKRFVLDDENEGHQETIVCERGIEISLSRRLTVPGTSI